MNVKWKENTLDHADKPTYLDVYWIGHLHTDATTKRTANNYKRNHPQPNLSKTQVKAFKLIAKEATRKLNVN